MESINVRVINPSEIDNLRMKVNEILATNMRDNCTGTRVSKTWTSTLIDQAYTASISGSPGRQRELERLIFTGNTFSCRAAKDILQSIMYSKRTHALPGFDKDMGDNSFYHLAEIQYNELLTAIEVCKWLLVQECVVTSSDFATVLSALSQAEFVKEHWGRLDDSLSDWANTYCRLCEIFALALDSVNVLDDMPDFVKACWYFRKFKSDDVIDRVTHYMAEREFVYDTNTNGISDDVAPAVLSRMVDIIDNSYLFNSANKQTPIVGKFQPVPKDWSKNRGVCMQTNVSKFESLALDQCLRAALHEVYSDGIDFINQESQQHRCWDFNWKSVDSSDSSDRQHMLLIACLYVRKGSNLFRDIYYSRPSIITYGTEGIPVLGLGGMGAPIVFSIQTHVCYLLPHVASYAHYGKRKRNVKSAAYGDDIEVRGVDFDVLFPFMEALGMQPNVDKSFDNDCFRESCGCWVYKDAGGYMADVTPVFWPRKEFSYASQNDFVRIIVSLIEHGNSLRRHGYSEAAQAVGEFIYSKVSLPNHSDVGSIIRLPVDLHFNQWGSTSHWSEVRGTVLEDQSHWRIQESEISNVEWTAQLNHIGQLVKKDDYSITLGQTFVISGDYLLMRNVTGHISRVYERRVTGDWCLTTLRGVKLGADSHLATVTLNERRKALINEWLMHNSLVKSTEAYRHYHVDKQPYISESERIIKALFEDTTSTSIRNLKRLPSEIRFESDYYEFHFAKRDNLGN